MKRLSTAIVAIALIGTPAFAADMAVKAPPAAPAPVYNWTGWYAGVNAGASFGDVKTDFNTDTVTVHIPGPPVFVNGFSQSDRVYPSGFMGGGQIGYNWQFSPIWVLGLEADIQGALEKDSATLTSAFASTQLGDVDVVGTAVTNYQTKIDWFGTVRLRAGYVWGNGDVFSYVTGGLAYGKVDLEGTSTISGTAAAIPFSTTHTFGHSHVNTGWTVGYGTEGRLATPGWTWKVEGLYIDLGTLDDPDNPGGVVNASGGTVTTHTHFKDGILRGGLNYQFH